MGKGISHINRRPESQLAEAKSLVRSIGLNPAYTEIIRLQTPKSSTLLGLGKLSSLSDFINSNSIEVVIIDSPLTAIQQRNLERNLNTKVIDRTALILEIFAARARTKEGRLQVELAALTYQRSRLVRSWTHLERQRGGGGFLSGPGETQIESDRRQIDGKIKKIKQSLAQVVKTRKLHRDSRKRVPYPIIALVGYTNAGKSTLFNLLTGSSVKVADQLFATLDPTMRTLKLPCGQKTILSDTVGFVSELPHGLISAFSATLEEVVTADLILHVRDISHPEASSQKSDVIKVLAELGLEEKLENIKIIEVLNKIDCISETRKLKLLKKTSNKDECKQILVSAKSGDGIKNLTDEISTELQKNNKIITACAPLENGALQAWIYEKGEVIERRNDDQFAWLTVKLANKDIARLSSKKDLIIYSNDYFNAK